MGQHHHQAAAWGLQVCRVGRVPAMVSVMLPLGDDVGGGGEQLRSPISNYPWG